MPVSNRKEADESIIEETLNQKEGAFENLGENIEKLVENIEDLASDLETLGEDIEEEFFGGSN